MRSTLRFPPESEIPRFLLPGAAALLLGCSAGPAKLVGDVNVYVFEESVPPALFDVFHAQTGVTVHLSTYATNEEMLASLAAHPADYDVIMPSDYAVDALIHRDGLRPLELGEMPNYANIAPSFLSPWFDPGGIATPGRGRTRNQKFSLPWLWGTTGIAYDSTQVLPAPSHWADVWNPAWAGRVVAPDDARELLGVALQADGNSKNDTSPAKLAVAKERAITLAKASVALDSNAPETYFADGRAVIGIVFNGNAALAKKSNAYIEFVLPEEGGGIWFDNLAIPAGAKNPDNAVALINHLLSAESGAEVVRAFPFSTPNEAALEHLRTVEPAPYAAYMADPIIHPPTDALAKAVPVKNIGSVGDARMAEAWTAVLAARGATP